MSKVRLGTPRMVKGECYITLMAGVAICFTKASIHEGVVVVEADSICVYVEKKAKDNFISVLAIVEEARVFQVHDSGHTRLLTFLRNECGRLIAKTTFVFSRGRKFGAVSVDLRSA